jgi:hypothetical protein
LFFVGRYTAPKANVISESPAKSIAVLPFENLSRDADNAYFADGTLCVAPRSGGVVAQEIPSTRKTIFFMLLARV